MPPSGYMVSLRCDTGPALAISPLAASKKCCLLMLIGLCVCVCVYWGGWGRGGGA
jgi:hypothetical protein